MALIDFLLNFGRLKRVPRTGWLLRGVSLGDVESVAEHTLRASILSIFIARLLNSKGADVDTLKVAEMAVLHDLAEAMILDMDQEVLKEIGYERKREMEHAAEGMLLEELPEDLKLKYRRLLDELHEGKSLEAKIVKASDKLEMMIQALEYSSKYSKAILRAFRQDVNEVEDFSL
ncbi:MAG: HD family hydrolase, partial [Candidatus Bathyarchaeia archaeon]